MIEICQAQVHSDNNTRVIHHVMNDKHCDGKEPATENTEVLYTSGYKRFVMQCKLIHIPMTYVLDTANEQPMLM